VKKESVGGPTCSGLIKSRPGLAWPNPVTLSHRSHGRSTRAPVLWTHTDGGEPMRKFPKACNPKHVHKCTTTAQQRIDANAAVRCPAGVPVQHTMRIPPYAIGSPGHFASVDRTRTFRHPTQWDAREGSVRSPCFPNRHPTQCEPTGLSAVQCCGSQSAAADQPGLFASVDRTRTFRHPKRNGTPAREVCAHNTHMQRPGRW
jgi:hypothetical protein